jgi:hypothetical protein
MDPMEASLLFQDPAIIVIVLILGLVTGILLVTSPWDSE